MRRELLAIDPGPTESAFVLFFAGVPRDFGKADNDTLLNSVRQVSSDHLAIEMVQSFGMPVGDEVFQTCLWVGRFIQAFGGPHTLVYRKDVKLHLCHSSRAKDGNVRQALLDRFGGKDKAVGRKATPGPLYGVSGDVWSALAIAVTWSDQHQREAVA